MQPYLHRIAAVMLLCVTVACSDPESAENAQISAAAGTSPIFRSLPPQEAKALIDSRKDLVLVDVRSPEELYEGSIPGSLLMPFGELAKGAATLPAGRPLLLICAVGGRSYAVGRYFSGRGHGEIYNLDGGISAWKGAGLPLVHP